MSDRERRHLLDVAAERERRRRWSRVAAAHAREDAEPALPFDQGASIDRVPDAAVEPGGDRGSCANRERES